MYEQPDGSKIESDVERPDLKPLVKAAPAASEAPAAAASEAPEVSEGKAVDWEDYENISEAPWSYL